MLDISNICRICLKEGHPKLPIFTEDDERTESKPTLSEKIMSFAQVKVVKDDGLPMYICVKCYCQVDTTVEFKRLCEESFHYFQRQLYIFSNLKAISPSPQEDKQNFDGEHHISQEDCMEVEEYEPEEEPPIQVLRIKDIDESLVNNDETEFDASLVKTETSLDYQDREFELSNVKIENYNDNLSDEEPKNTFEVNSEDFQVAKAPIDNGSVSTPKIDKPHKCKSCEIICSNRREMSFHTSVAHRRCSICAKYFYSNKEKGEHICDRVIENNMDSVDQYCHMCNTTVKQIESHVASHSKNTVKTADRNRETNMEKDGCVLPTQNKPETKMTVGKIKCSLCNVVCLNEKGLKVHLKFMHSGHRIIYPCFICTSIKFFSRVRCIKHLTEKHGIAANGNVKFELGQVKPEINSKDRQQRNFKKSCYKNKKKLKSRTQGLVQAKDKDLKEKVSAQKKPKKKKMEISPSKCLKQSHPPFSHMSPIVKNNFSVTLDHKGVKHYVCRGCEVIYKSHIAAYNHYYNYRYSRRR